MERSTGTNDRPCPSRSDESGHAVPHCAHPFVLFSPTKYPAKQGRAELLTAAVRRGPSEAARSGSKENSATPPAPHPPNLLVLSSGMGLIDLPLRASNEGLLRAARCASTGDQQAPSPPLSREHRANVGVLPILSIVRVPRAGARPGCPSFPIYPVVPLPQHPMVCVAGVSLSPLLGQSFQQDNIISY